MLYVSAACCSAALPVTGGGRRGGYLAGETEYCRRWQLKEQRHHGSVLPLVSLVHRCAAVPGERLGTAAPNFVAR